MNILILGATGRVGSQVAERAIREGHHLKLLVRQPEKVTWTGSQVTILQGNALQSSDLELAVQGVEVVISALNTDGTTTLSENIPLLIEAMKKHSLSRIITIGTAGILQSRTSPELLRYQSSESKRKLTRAAEEHHKAYLSLHESDLDWTIVCPTYLPDGAYTGKFRVERDLLPEGGMEISVPDTAEFTYQQIGSREYNRSRVGIAY